MNENPCPGALGRHHKLWCALHEGHDGLHVHYDESTHSGTGWDDSAPEAWHQSKAAS